MPTNFYFQSGDMQGTTSDQRLIEDLIIESVKIYGNDIYYLPRTLVAEDSLFDEDTLSQFTQAYPLEMYLENPEGFEGEGDLFTKFGIEVRDTATFLLPKRRWEHHAITAPYAPTLEDRPAEGDLLYFAKTKSLFEIKYVDFQNPFYQLGKIYLFRLQCELIDYSSEVLDTGITELDGIEDDFSVDMLNFKLQLEDGGYMLQEDSSMLILESFGVKTLQNTDESEFITLAEDILDFSEKNPFGEVI